MLSDFANVIAPVIAIVNSVIAVSVSHFKPEKQRLKIALLSTSIALGLIAAGGVIYGQYLVVHQRAQEAASRREISESLGQFIDQGRILMTQCTDEKAPAPGAAAMIWASQAEGFLSVHLGTSYVARFRNSAGLPLLVTTIQDDGHKQIWGFVNQRLARLEQFSEELKP